MNEQRLRDVVTAARESAVPFTMRYYHTCGTPGCLIGNYAARRDLQQMFQLAPIADGQKLGGFAFGVWGATRVPADWAGFSTLQSTAVRQFQLLADYFDITCDEAEDLFGSYGCNDALTAQQAVAYLEQFIKQRRSVG